MAVSGNHAAARALQQCSWLDGHGADLRALILEHGRLRRFSAGQWVFAEGDDSGGVHIVVDGTLQLYTQSLGGREVLLSHLQPGKAIGQSARFGAGPPLTTAVCLTDCVTLQVSDEALGTIADKQPLIWKSLASFLYLQQRVMVQMVAQFTSLPPRQLIAARLASLTAGQDPNVPLRLSQQALGDMVGLSRKTVNALLADLEARALIRRSYGAIEVRDLAGLQDYAATPPAEL